MAIFTTPCYSTPVKDGSAHWYFEHDGSRSSTPYSHTRAYSSANARIGPCGICGRSRRGIGTSWLVWGSALPSTTGCSWSRKQLLARARRRDPRRAVPRPHSGSCGGRHRAPALGGGFHRLLSLRLRPRSRGGLGGGVRASLGRSDLRPHDPRRTRESLRVRRSLHVRRRHVERRLSAVSAQEPRDSSEHPPWVRLRTPSRRGTRHRLETTEALRQQWKTAIRAERIVTITSYNVAGGKQIETARVEVASRLRGAWGKAGVAAQRRT